MEYPYERQEEPKVVTQCQMCKMPIYEDELYFKFDELELCMDCRNICTTSAELEEEDNGNNCD